MTTPTESTPITRLNEFPLMPPRSTESRLEHFDETVYRADPTTVIYKLVDALCGDSGAGDLKKQAFLRRLSQTLDCLYFSDLDYIFGGMGFLSRSEEESYSYDPMNDMLTSDQWDEVRIKDAWYRARVRDFFVAAGHGGTPEGLRMATIAGTSVDCDIYEVWRYMDNFGIPNAIGRSPVSTRAEYVIKPHKSSLGNKERRLLRQMLTRIAPADVVTTIDMNGLAVHIPVTIKAAAADSTYFEVQKEIVASPIVEELPPPEHLEIDLLPSECWLFNAIKNAVTAPYAAFNITQEYGYYYLIRGGARSPIDSVLYGTLQADGVTVELEQNFESFRTTEQFTAWMEYEKADNPDNFPGGKFGVTPDAAPAKHPDGTPYVFQYSSQEIYVAKVQAEVRVAGGEADDIRFRLTIVGSATTKKVYTPDLAVAYNPPIRDTTVTSSWCRSAPTSAIGSFLRDPKPSWINAGVVT